MTIWNVKEHWKKKECQLKRNVIKYICRQHMYNKCIQEADMWRKYKLAQADMSKAFNAKRCYNLLIIQFA